MVAFPYDATHLQLLQKTTFASSQQKLRAFQIDGTLLHKLIAYQKISNVCQYLQPSDPFDPSTLDLT